MTATTEVCSLAILSRIDDMYLQVSQIDMNKFIQKELCRELVPLSFKQVNHRLEITD
jgi:hypothetical protein